MAEFADPVPAGLVIAELARRTSVRHLMSPGWPVLGARAGEPRRWPPGDALAVVDIDEAVHDLSGDYPADLLLLETPGQATGQDAEPHPVTGRVQAEQVVGRAMTWADYEALPLHESLNRLQASGVAGLGPIDESCSTPSATCADRRCRRASCARSRGPGTSSTSRAGPTRSSTRSAAPATPPSPGCAPRPACT